MASPRSKAVSTSGNSQTDREVLFETDRTGMPLLSNPTYASESIFSSQAFGWWRSTTQFFPRDQDSTGDVNRSAMPT
jgi:hypothetical protein